MLQKYNDLDKMVADLTIQLSATLDINSIALSNIFPEGVKRTISTFKCNLWSTADLFTK